MFNIGIIATCLLISAPQEFDIPTKMIELYCEISPLDRQITPLAHPGWCIRVLEFEEVRLKVLQYQLEGIEGMVILEAWEKEKENVLPGHF
jgi:hypothetical protein